MHSVDDLAQEIRRVDGNHSLGAGALAEALFPFMKNVDLERERLFKEALEVIAQNNYDEALKGGNDIWSYVLALAIEKLKESEKQVEKHVI